MESWYYVSSPEGQLSFYRGVEAIQSIPARVGLHVTPNFGDTLFSYFFEVLCVRGKLKILFNCITNLYRA
jgi:hypothetical protein